MPAPALSVVRRAVEALIGHSLLRCRAQRSRRRSAPRSRCWRRSASLRSSSWPARGEDGPGSDTREYFVALAAQAEPTYWGDAPGDWRAVIGIEEGNLEAALVWATENGEADLALRLTSARFDPHLDHRYFARDRREWLATGSGRWRSPCPACSPVQRVRGR